MNTVYDSTWLCHKLGSARSIGQKLTQCYIVQYIKQLL